MIKSSQSTSSRVSGVIRSFRDGAKRTVQKMNDLVTESRRSTASASARKGRAIVKADDPSLAGSHAADSAGSSLTARSKHLLVGEVDDALSHLDSESTDGIPHYEANPQVAGAPLVKKMTATVSRASTLLEDLVDTNAPASYGFHFNRNPRQAILDELEDCFKESKNLLDNAKAFKTTNPALWTEAWQLHRMMEHIFHVEAKVEAKAN